MKKKKKEIMVKTGLAIYPSLLKELAVVGKNLGLTRNGIIVRILKENISSYK